MKTVKALEPEFAYLAMLTGAGLKPLSRWEKPLSRHQHRILQQQGLFSLEIRRLASDGASTTESVFSARRDRLDVYYKYFAGKPITRSITEQELEGRLFGYPACCIDYFIHFSYAPNGLPREDQRLLFYWACPECPETHLLLPRYREIDRRCRQYFASPEPRRAGSQWLKSLTLAASLSTLVLTGMQCNLDWLRDPEVLPADPHLLALPRETDKDGDYLEDRYEPLLNLRSDRYDTDHDGIADGPDIAMELLSLYKALPDQPRSDGPYVEHHMMRGLETCSVCLQTVNMGYATLINPLENMSLELPYIFLHHTFDHGSFSYDGSLHGPGRVNAASLKIVLSGNGTSRRPRQLLEPTR